jgi:hypothetical protein
VAPRSYIGAPPANHFGQRRTKLLGDWKLNEGPVDE